MLNEENFEFIPKEYETILKNNQEVSMLIRFSNQNKNMIRRTLKDKEQNDIMKGVHQLIKSGMFLDKKRLKFDFSYPFRKLRILLNQNVSYTMCLIRSIILWGGLHIKRNLRVRDPFDRLPGILISVISCKPLSLREKLHLVINPLHSDLM